MGYKCLGVTFNNKETDEQEIDWRIIKVIKYLNDIFCSKDIEN